MVGYQKVVLADIGTYGIKKTDVPEKGIIVKNTKGSTTGIITDGTVRRTSQKVKDLHNLSVKKVMTLNPISVHKDTLAEKALAIMNEKKITSLCIFSKKNRDKTIGIIHIHNILEANVL